jgi:hypothetical protein
MSGFRRVHTSSNVDYKIVKEGLALHDVIIRWNAYNWECDSPLVFASTLSFVFAEGDPGGCRHLLVCLLQHLKLHDTLRRCSEIAVSV